MKKFLLSLLCLAGLSASAQTYQLVTEVTTADLGTSEYILVGYNATQKSYQAAAKFNTKYFEVVSVTVTNDACDITNVEGVQKFTIVAGTEADSYALKTADGKLVNFTGTSNQNMTLVDAAAKSASFTLSFSDGGNAQLVNCDKTTRGLKYNASSPRFSNYATSSQTYGFLYKLTATKEVATPAFSVAAGTVEAGTTVEITCATEGAEIYYTLDGTTPDKTSTKYTEALTINETTTVKAIAYVGDKDSNVASATYTVVVPDTFEEVLAMANGDTFLMGTDLTVAKKPAGDERYIYVYADGKYGLLYDSKKNQTLNDGDVIANGWSGSMVYYSGLPEITTTATLTTTGETGTIPAPAEVAVADITNALVNNIIVVKDVVFEAATPNAATSATNFTGKVGETSLTFRNTFKLQSQEAGTYNVTCVVSVFTNKATTLSDNIQLLPLEYAEKTTGIADIEADNNVAPVYYNLQGVRVANPENGMFIEVRDNKAVKVIK